MDSEERAMTALIKNMIQNGLIFAADVADVISYRLSPLGAFIASLMAKLFRRLASGATWEDIKKVENWRELVIVVCGAALDLCIRNVSDLIYLAEKAAEFLTRLSKGSQQKHIGGEYS